MIKKMKKIGILILFVFSIFGMVKFYSIYKSNIVETIKDAKRGVEESYKNLKSFSDNS